MLDGQMKLPHVILPCVLIFGCSSLDRRHSITVSVTEQKMEVTDRGRLVAIYPVSTSKYGVGSRPGSNATPLGRHRIAKKIGGSLPEGAVLKSRRFTGEVLRPNTPGRDPVVTRILWLDGAEARNRSSFSRHIYIHGTPDELHIGTKASLGCIRMRSRDIVSLFDRVGAGARVDIVPGPIRDHEPMRYGGG